MAVKALERGGASAGATSLDGDHRDDAIFASALREFESDRPSFGLKVSQLMKISAVYSFPPDPLPHLPRAGASIAERFTCFEKTCTRCGTLYEEKADQSAEAVTQVYTVGIHAVWYGNILYLVVLCVRLRNIVVLLWSAQKYGLGLLWVKDCPPEKGPSMRNIRSIPECMRDILPRVFLRIVVFFTRDRKCLYYTVGHFCRYHDEKDKRSTAHQQYE